MSRTPHVVLLHAYSSHNSGDGLLVDLSTTLVRDAFGAATRISIVAADPASFPAYRDVHAAPVLAASGLSRLAAAIGTPLPVRINPALAQLRQLVQSADLLLGVGGGYLRARTAAEALKLEAGHLLQMRLARATQKPAVYLPQSIGPAAGNTLLARHLRATLGSFDTVFVRDDRSADFLAGNANTRRAPDLAALQFGHRAEQALARIPRSGTALRHIALVLRRPPAWSEAQCQRYRTSTMTLIERLRATCRLTFAVQSTGRGNDDSAYYRTLGLHAERSLKSVLADDTPDIVVSVRLHGALEAILHGVPAYHLSYERKGFGAYADLGVSDWVANAANFDADAVASHLVEPDACGRFWEAAQQGLSQLKQHRQQIVSSMRAALNSKDRP